MAKDNLGQGSEAEYAARSLNRYERATGVKTLPMGYGRASAEEVQAAKRRLVSVSGSTIPPSHPGTVTPGRERE